jgi:hypothetical protein
VIADWTWADLRRDLGPVGESPYLPYNGYYALLAFACGPNYATEISVDGSEVEQKIGFHVPLTMEDWDGIEEDRASYLRSFGVPRPPGKTTWRLVFPEHTDYQRLSDLFYSLVPEVREDHPTETIVKAFEDLVLRVQSHLKAQGDGEPQISA